MTSIKVSYSTSGSAVGSYFYEYEFEYKIPSSFSGSLPVSGSKPGSFSVTEVGNGMVKHVLGYGINLI